MSEARVVKKYANRRLYDTEISSYITQEQIKEYVATGIKLKIINAKTEEDVTRSVLLHIILDEEVLGVPLFTEEALRSIIVFSGSSMRSSFSDLLEQMLPTLQQYKINLPSGFNDDARDKLNSRYAAMQGLLFGNAFREYMNRSMEMIMKTNQQLANSAVDIITPTVDFEVEKLTKPSKPSKKRSRRKAD